MTAFRRRLRVSAAAWLLIQVVSLSAFIPADCCAAHSSNAGAAKAHCPMHADEHHHQPAESTTQCSMRGTCGGPVAALVVLLSNHGVLTAPFALSPEANAGLVTDARRENLTRRLASPEPPPPRA
jgi:hypothetical protein